MRVENLQVRQWYEQEAKEQMWSYRTLDGNISTLYYERMLMSQVKESVVQEMQEKTKEFQQDKLEFIKNPAVLEFLGLPGNMSYREQELEKAILDNLQEFLMEMGKGFAFVGRQKLVRTDTEDYYIDLVFFNYLLNCFVLVDLKVGKITHQDVGQMDMYVRMFDELKRGEGHNPTIGIVLCSETSKDMARYSILKGNEQLFATKYKLLLPTPEELQADFVTMEIRKFLQFPHIDVNASYPKKEICLQNVAEVSYVPLLYKNWTSGCWKRMNIGIGKKKSLNNRSCSNIIIFLSTFVTK